MDITLENYEFAFFQYEEGLLSPEERREVEAFCQEHPELGEELQLAMECPKLQPIAVAAPTTRRAIVIPLWAKRALSAAACVGLLIGIGVQLWGPSWEGGLTSLPQPDRAEVKQPVKPISAAPRDRLVSLSSQELGSDANLDRLVSLSSQAEPLYAECSIQQVDSEEFQLLLAQNYIEASEMLALSTDEPAPKSEEELSHPISTWLARQKEAALMQLAEFFTQKFNH